MEPLIITFCRWQKTQDFKLNENCSEVRNTGIKTKHILIRLCGTVLWLTLNKLQAVSVGTVGGLSHLISLSNFSPHVCKHVGCNCSYSTLYPPSKFLQSGVQWWNVCCILYVPPVEEVKWRRSCYRWQSNRAASTCQFLWNLLIQEVLNCNMKCRSAPACWNSVTRALVFWNNGRWDSSTLFTYTVLVTVHSARRKGPNIAL